MTIRRKTAYNLDAQQVSLVLEAMKAHRKLCIDIGHDAAQGGNEKSSQEYIEKVRKYDNLIQYFEEKGQP
jgi:hypothetical protein